MLSEKEQEEIINQFWSVIEMKKIINNKVRMCTKCKFTPQHMNLYHVPLSENGVKNICNSLIQRCRAGRLRFFVRAPGPWNLVLWRASF